MATMSRIRFLRIWQCRCLWRYRWRISWKKHTTIFARVHIPWIRLIGKYRVRMKPQSHLAEYIFRLFTIEINSANANNRNDKNTICDYPNINECVSDYMKIHHDWLSPSITGMETSWRPVSDSSLRGSRSLEIWRVARESRWNQTSSILRLFGDFFKSPVGLGDVAAT